MSRDYILQPFRALPELRIDYERELNEQQRAAVTAPPGPALVIAGAGSGKTRTLTYRTAFLLEQGIPADRILLLTFTNKAAHEMMRRVADLLGQEALRLWGGTFHSIGYRILRRNAELLGYRPDFTILDREDARQMLQSCLPERPKKAPAGVWPKSDVMAEVFSLAVNTCRSIAKVIQDQFEHLGEIAGRLAEVHRDYQERKRTAQVMDFDDLLSEWLRLLRDHPGVCERYQRQFQFVLVDEYQDTNRVQSDLIDLVAARHRQVMAVGDDAQSIYSWRGADYRNLWEFPRRYPEATVYKIETNYRSTPEILAVANAAIAANARQFPKTLAPSRPSGARPVRVDCFDTGQQAAFVAQRIFELHEGGTSLNQMAVLYRSHFHSLELQMELTRRRVPFAIMSGIRFFEQAHLKDVIAFLKLGANPEDDLSFRRIVRLLSGIGERGADRLWERYRSAPAAAGSGANVATRLEACLEAVPKKAHSDWPKLADTFRQLASLSSGRDPSPMIRLVIEAFYDEHLKEAYANYRSRREDLDQLCYFARQFQDLNDFLAQLALLTDLEAEEDRAWEKQDQRVRLSTIHQAKGLEFDIVFLIMLNDGLFPVGRSLGDPDREEEERRLFHVAITRARLELYLIAPLMRFGRGPANDPGLRPSRFLIEIPESLCDAWNLHPHGLDPGF